MDNFCPCFKNMLLKHSYCGNVPLNQTPVSVVLPPPFFLDWYNIKGRKCRRHEPTAPGDHWKQPYKVLFFVWGGGYNDARGLISREITAIVEIFEPRKLHFSSSTDKICRERISICTIVYRVFNWSVIYNNHKKVKSYIKFC